MNRYELEKLIEAYGYWSKLEGFAKSAKEKAEKLTMNPNIYIRKQAHQDIEDMTIAENNANREVKNIKVQISKALRPTDSFGGSSMWKMCDWCDQPQDNNPSCTCYCINCEVHPDECICDGDPGVSYE